MGLEKVGTKFITAWAKAGEKSLLVKRPVKINIQQPLIYKPKYDHEFKKILDTFDEALPLQYRQAVTRHKLNDEIKAYGRVLNHDIEYDGLKAIGINPSNMDSETTFLKLLSQRERGNYGSLFIGQGEFTGNVVVNNYLRTGKITHESWNLQQIENVVKSARNAMNRIKLPHDTILYRCVRDSDFIPEVGETFIEKGFLSTSINRSSAFKYGGKLIKIYARKETGCIPNLIDFEILLKDHSKFKVLSNDGFSYELLLL